MYKKLLFYLCYCGCASMKAILFPTRKNLVKEDLEKAKKKLIYTN